jgi:DNA primase
MKNKWFEVKIISLTWWKDPDEILKSWVDFNPYIKDALTPIGYYIKKAKFDPGNLDEKKKLLAELIGIVKSYSDNIERDYYLKEIANLLDLNTKIIYDLFNRTRISNKSNDNDQAKRVNVSSEDTAIGYIINKPEYLDILKKEIIFPEAIWKSLLNIVSKGIKYLDELELSEKERYKGIALKIEMDTKHKTEEHNVEEVAKLVLWINREIYKNRVELLKSRISSWDVSALQEYSTLIKTAKSHGIK